MKAISLKKWKKRRNIPGIVMLFFLLFVHIVSAEDGSVSMKFHEKAVGAEVTLFQIADYVDGQFVVKEVFLPAGFSVDMLSDAEKVQIQAGLLSTIAREEEADGLSGAISEDGNLKFSELPAGIYVLTQTGGMDQIALQNAIIPIPAITSSGVLEYNIEADYSRKCSFPDGAALVYKVDDEDERVADAVFDLQKKVYLTSDMEVSEELEVNEDVSGKFVWVASEENLKTNQNGEIALNGLTYGMYRLIERIAPDGYLRNTAEHYFSVKEEGLVSESENGLFEITSGNAAEVTIVDQPSRMEVNKVDEDGNPLPGAHLTIKDANGDGILEEDGSMKYDLLSAEEAVEVKKLPNGDYYLSELSAPDGYKVAEDIPFTIDGNQNPQTVVIQMVDQKQSASEYILRVTKKLTDLDDNLLIAEEASFFVALFSDAEFTKRVSNVKEISFHRQSSETVVFENLIPGETYYLAETDMFGAALDDFKLDSLPYIPVYEEQKIEMLPSRKNTESEFANVYAEFPDGFFYEGSLTITKKVLRGSEEYETEETFYAGIFEDPNFTDLYQLVPLQMDGESEVSVTVPVGIDRSLDGSKTYYVKETDKNGTPLRNGSGLEYTISQDKEKIVVFVNEKNEVTITNTYQVKEVVTPVPSENAPESPQGSQGVRTGDETTVAGWILLSVTAMLVAGWILKKKRSF